jgi:glycerol-3-phosphate dehydrogenase
VILRRPISRLSESFDVVIIGGGITGVMVAREAACRGLRVALVDRGDFGSETSASTTKFIHGGIRYLEQYDFAVVRESLRERRILALGAPHLVRQTRFVMPAWRWSKPSTPLIGAGVLLYDALSFDRNRDMPESLKIGHPKWLSRKQVRDAVPWLDDHQLQGAFAYDDTMNLHPERLLLAYVKAAVDAGAVLVNHVSATGFVTEQVGLTTVVVGVTCRDELSGLEHVVRGRVVVNAAGPWIDRVLAELGRDTGVGVDRSKGVHILTRPLGGRGRVTDAVFARAKSGRHVIVSPWMGQSFIGPTDTPMGDGDPVAVEPGDVAEILETVNSTMARGEKPLTGDDVTLTTVGVRPLIRTAKDRRAGTYSASRRHELYHHTDHGVENLWSIGGGKWTTGRATAEEMVDSLFAHELHDRRQVSWNSRHARAFGTFAWAEDAEQFLRQGVTALVAGGMGVKSAEHIVRLYGAEYQAIIDVVATDPRLTEVLDPRSSSPDVAAQVVFAVTHEAACTLSDIVDRRLALGTVGPVNDDVLTKVAAVAGPFLGWDPQRVASEVGREASRRRATEVRWRGGVVQA